MKVLVCGGRDYVYWRELSMHLDRYLSKRPTIIQGGAKGADYLAKVWAVYHNLRHFEEPADWKTFGRSAGSIRNAVMLEKYSPDLVVAFRGGRGTADMIAKAKNAGVPVVEVGREQN